jgi:hypothetical protein
MVHHLLDSNQLMGSHHRDSNSLELEPQGRLVVQDKIQTMEHRLLDSSLMASLRRDSNSLELWDKERPVGQDRIQIMAHHLQDLANSAQWAVLPHLKGNGPWVALCPLSNLNMVDLPQQLLHRRRKVSCHP